MTLPAHEAPHFLPARVNVGVIVVFAIATSPTFDARQMRDFIFACSQSCNSFDEAGACHSNVHRFGIVTVDTTDWVHTAKIMHRPHS